MSAEDASAVEKACTVFQQLDIPSEWAASIFDGLHKAGVVLQNVSNMSYHNSGDDFSPLEVALLKAGYTLSEAQDIVIAIHEAGMIVHKVES